VSVALVVRAARSVGEDYVFESAGEALWFSLQERLRELLQSLFALGALDGKNAEEAFAVRCDRSTMTQNDLDNGRLICLIGIAPVKPAEFVIFRIGQWTGDAQ
jgi:phage tail sheath protein FI